MLQHNNRNQPLEENDTSRFHINRTFKITILTLLIFHAICVIFIYSMIPIAVADIIFADFRPDPFDVRQQQIASRTSRDIVNLFQASIAISYLPIALMDIAIVFSLKKTRFRQHSKTTHEDDN